MSDQAPTGQQAPVRQQVPKCQSCGAITPWKVEPLLLPLHIVVTLVFLCLAGAGLIYLGITVALRMNPNNRAKICPRCGARNLWTFLH